MTRRQDSARDIRKKISNNSILLTFFCLPLSIFFFLRKKIPGSIFVNQFGLKPTHGCIMTRTRTASFVSTHESKLTAENNRDSAYISKGFEHGKKLENIHNRKPFHEKKRDFVI